MQSRSVKVDGLSIMYKSRLDGQQYIPQHWLEGISVSLHSLLNKTPQYENSDYRRKQLIGVQVSSPRLRRRS